MKRTLKDTLLAQWLGRFFANIDGWLLLCMLLLGGLGMLTLYSASGYGSQFDGQLTNWLVVLVVFVIFAQIQPKYLLHLAVPIYVVGVVLLIGVALFGETRKGATRWLNLIVLSIQPSELMKLAVPMMLAWWFHQRERLKSGINFVIAFVLLIVPVYLILIQPDLGTALLIMAAGLAIIFLAGLSWWSILPPLILAGGALMVLFMNQAEWCAAGYDWPFLHDYQVKRICTLFDPEADPLKGGYHIIQSTIAIGSGGLTGKGYMQGTQAHFDFIPERTTDFIFAVYAEEFGLVGGVILLLLFLLLIWRGYMIAAMARMRFSQLLAGGVTTIFLICSFVNLGMVSGILPVVGIPLPFISYGGTALVSFAMCAGVLMSISAQNKREYRAAGPTHF